MTKEEFIFLCDSYVDTLNRIFYNKSIEFRYSLDKVLFSHNSSYSTHFLFYTCKKYTNDREYDVLVHSSYDHVSDDDYNMYKEFYKSLIQYTFIIDSEFTDMYGMNRIVKSYNTLYNEN